MLPVSPEDTFAFWQGLKDSGLLEEVIHEFHQELVETMKGLQQRAQDPPLQLGGKDLDTRGILGGGLVDFFILRDIWMA